MRGKKGFTLVEMMVAVVVLVIITVPIMLVFYFGVMSLESQIGETQALSISRETMQVIMNDLEKYSCNATKISPEYSEEEREYVEAGRTYHERYGERYYQDGESLYYDTKLVIRDDDTLATTPKKIIYTYRKRVVDGVSYDRVLLREVDDVVQVLLTDNQLNDRYYTDVQKREYDVEHKEPVVFTKDDARNRISVYLRIKLANKAKAQESEYAYTVGESDKTRQLLRFETDGYIKTADSESFNLYQSSFTIESYFKMDNIDKQRCLVNLMGIDDKSKVSVIVENKELTIRIGEDTTNPSKFKVARVSLMNGSDDCTTNLWRKFVIVYDDTKNKVSMYLTQNGDGSKLDTNERGSQYISTESAFYGSVGGNKKPIIVDKIYLGNMKEGDDGYNDNYYDDDGRDYYVYMYETKIWNKAIDVSKYDVTRKLVGDEDGLLLYMKDDYKRSSAEDKVILNVVNAVNNKSMVLNDVLASEELESADKTTNENLRNILGY